MAKSCFATTYSKKLTEIYTRVASKLQQIIRTMAKDLHVEAFYNIEIIPLTEDFPKVKTTGTEGSIVPEVSHITLHFVYCFGRGFAKVLMQNYGLLHRVMAVI